MLYTSWSIHGSLFLFSRHQLVWVDETGSNARDHARKFGYAIRGCTSITHCLLMRGERVNAIAAIASSGLVAFHTVTESVTGHTFFDFLRGTLIPQMMPFNGANPHSVLILDNCSVHHIYEVKDLLQQAGILVLFLPPYSPNLNPIDLEEAFNYVKCYLRKHDDVLQSEPPLQPFSTLHLNPSQMVNAMRGLQILDTLNQNVQILWIHQLFIINM